MYYIYISLYVRTIFIFYDPFSLSRLQIINLIKNTNNHREKKKNVSCFYCSDYVFVFPTNKVDMQCLFSRMNGTRYLSDSKHSIIIAVM